MTGRGALGVLLALLVALAVPRGGHAAERGDGEPSPAASDVPRTARGAPLYATMAGKRTTIAESALAVWVVDQGRTLVYSAADGAGGYENEGQALYLYDPKTGERRKIMAEYFMIEDVREIRTRRAKVVLLVQMRDGGLGASHVAVVDPARGEVFYGGGAEVESRQGDTITVGYYREEDWEKIRSGTKVTPYRREQIDLAKIDAMSVIVKPPTNAEPARKPTP